MSAVIGLDLSMTATGFACATYVDVVKSAAKGMLRLFALQSSIVDACDGAGLVVVEGYSMGTARQQSHAHALGELGGVVRLALWQKQIPYVDVAPAAPKKFATGKGNANKTAMATAASRCGYDGPDDDNAIDAWWLRQMGLYVTSGAEVPETEYRADAVAKITWPFESAAVTA